MLFGEASLQIPNATLTTRTAVVAEAREAAGDEFGQAGTERVVALRFSRAEVCQQE